MICDFDDDYIFNLLKKQLDIFKITARELNLIQQVYDRTQQRVDFNFTNSENKYYKRENDTYFNPFHSGQWTIFLYYLSHTLFHTDAQNRLLCDKIYYLNRMLNACDLFYEVNLPDIFALDHPLGSVIGRAEIDDYFYFTQGCTVGNNHSIFPKIGKNVSMLSNSKIIGNCQVGDRVIISANTYVKDTDIPNDTIVFGSSPNLVIKKR